MIKYIVLAAGILAATTASSATLNVLATDSVYGAGLGPNGASTAPKSFSFTAGLGQFLRFSSVTGLTDCCSGTPGIGPDGGSNTGSGTTDVSGLNGIAGISAPTQMFLAGVFINSKKPPVSGSEPLSRSYTAASLGNQKFTVGVNRVFFIGDGKSATGTVQKFFLPGKADTLLLGFVDSFGFHGLPGYYGDNTGSLTATFQIRTAPAIAAVPLPAGMPLLAGGLAALVAFARRRKSA